MIGWALAALLAASACVLAQRVWRLRPEEAVLAGLLLALSEAEASSLLLGLAGLLRPAEAIGALIAFALAHVAATYVWGRDGLNPARWTLPKALWPAAGLTGLVLAWRLWLSAALPFESWDGLTYHLPMVLRWLQQGNLSLAGWSGPQRYFPPNGELLPTWLALLSGGALEGAKNAQALTLPLWAAAGAVLGRRLAGPRWSAACALALASLPIVIIQSGVPYVDLTHSACWLAAAACALCYDRAGRPLLLALWAVAFGLSLGTKATVYFQAPLIIQPLVTFALRPERRRDILRLLPAAMGMVMLTGGYSYLSDWLRFGNPVFPYTFSLAGHTIFHGITAPGELLVSVEHWFVARPIEWLVYPFRETMRGSVGYGTEDGFGALFAAGWALWPFVFAASLKRRDAGAAAFFAVLPAGLLLFMTLHPTREPRYIIFLAAVPIAALAYALRGLRGAALALARLGWTIGLAWGLLGVAAYAGSDPALASAWRSLRRTGRIDALQYYSSQYGSLGKAWAALNARLKPGDVVVTNYGELVLPLAGVPARGRIQEVGTKPSDYPDTYWGAKPADWMAALDRLDARYYLWWSPSWYTGVGATERAFMAQLPGRFSSLGAWDSKGFGAVELFAIEPSTAPVAASAPR